MSKSSMKKMTAGVGLALIGTTSVAGAANAITTDEAKPLKYEGAVSAETYGKTTQDIPVDYSALDEAVKAAEAQGVKVSAGETQEVTVSSMAEAEAKVAEAKKESTATIAKLREAVKTIADNKADAKKAEKANADRSQIEKQIADIKAENEKIAKENEEATKRYNEAKAAYDKLYAEQVSNANPYKAINNVDKLALEQPFELVDSPNNLATINGKAPAGSTADRTDFPDSWSSEYAYRFTNLDPNNPNLTMKYKGVAIDKETKRPLDVEVKILRFVSNPNGSPVGADGSPKWQNMYDVYSSYNDIVAMQKSYASEVQLYFTYGDTGEKYEKKIYNTVGSLNAQENNGTESAVRYEITAPGKGVLATFVNKESRIAPEAQKVHGTASQLVDRGFYIKAGSNQGGAVFDENDDALKYLGVTYLMENGGTFFFGTTGNEGVPGTDGVIGDPQNTGASRYSDYSIDASYNHLMLSANTVAPTAVAPVKPQLKPLKPVPELPPVVKPTPKPVPEVKVNKKVIKLANVAPEKTVANEDIVIPAGNDLPTQTVTGNTGVKAPEQFSITDLVEYAKDGDGNWRALVSITEDKLKVVDADGKDVTNLFDIKVEKGKLVSGTGTDFDGHVADVVTATAKEPGKLAVNTPYSLKVESKSLNDFKADEMRDLGVVTINNKPIVTSIHRVKEITGQVNKELTTPASEVKPGATLRWKAQAKNASGADMEKAVISEFPDNAQFDVASVKFLNTNGRGVVNGNVWEIGELKAGETVEFEVEVTLKNDLDMARVASEGILNTIVLTNNPTPEDPTPTTPPKECQVNATVDEDTDGCDMTVTKVTPPPVTPETPKPSEPAKPEQPKPIEKAKAETGDTGYGITGMDATTVAVAGGIGILALAGGAVYFTKRRKKNAEDAS
jgi:LPXTG-motif cell wall-anchored protein